MTVAAQREEKRRTVACMKAIRFLSKDRFEVVRVNCGIASISPFRIDILLSSKSIQFGTKTTRAEPNGKVKLGKVLRPLCLSLG